MSVTSDYFPIAYTQHDLAHRSIAQNSKRSPSDRQSQHASPGLNSPQPHRTPWIGFPGAGKKKPAHKTSTSLPTLPNNITTNNVTSLDWRNNDPSLLSLMAMYVRHTVPRVKGHIIYPGAFTGKDIVVRQSYGYLSSVDLMVRLPRIGNDSVLHRNRVRKRPRSLH